MRRIQKRRERSIALSLTAPLFAVLLVLGCLTANSQQTPQSKESTLTETQIRQGLRDTLDSLKDTRERLQAASDHVASLEKENADRKELIQAAREKAELLAELAAEKEARIKDLQSALAKSELRTQVEMDGRERAENEVERQKNKVTFWRKATPIAAMVGVITGLVLAQ